MAHGPDENSGRAGRMAGFAGVVIAMSPILADEQRPVGRAWPAAQRPGFTIKRKRKFARGVKCRGPGLVVQASGLGGVGSAAGGAARARRRRTRRRQETPAPTARQMMMPM